VIILSIFIFIFSNNLFLISDITRNLLFSCKICCEKN